MVLLGQLARVVELRERFVGDPEVGVAGWGACSSRVGLLGVMLAWLARAEVGPGGVVVAGDKPANGRRRVEEHD